MAAERRQRRRVGFHEADPAGVAHFTVLQQWVEELEHDWLRAAGFELLVADAEGGRTGWPRVRVTADYRLPIPLGAEVEVVLRLSKVGDRSVHWAAEIRLDGEPAAAITMVVAHARLAVDGGGAAIDVPADFAARMAAVTGESP